MPVPAHFLKPRPSMRTTIHVFGSRLSACSNCRTYSYLDAQSWQRAHTAFLLLGQESRLHRVRKTPGETEDGAHLELAIAN